MIGPTDIQLRHDEIYATRGLKAFEYSDLDGRIFAGRNPLSARDVEILAGLGITHILDLREEWEWQAPKFGRDALDALNKTAITRLHLPILDMRAPTPQDFQAACDFIEQALSTPNAKVYVHCRAGMERTAAILIAFHARQHGLSYDAALAELRMERPIFRPLPDQERAARRWLATTQDK